MIIYEYFIFSHIYSTCSRTHAASLTTTHTIIVLFKLLISKHQFRVKCHTFIIYYICRSLKHKQRRIQRKCTIITDGKLLTTKHPPSPTHWHPQIFTGLDHSAQVRCCSGAALRINGTVARALRQKRTIFKPKSTFTGNL